MKIPYRVTDQNRDFWNFLVTSSIAVAEWPTWKRWMDEAPHVADAGESEHLPLPKGAGSDEKQER